MTEPEDRITARLVEALDGELAGRLTPPQDPPRATGRRRRWLPAAVAAVTAAAVAAVLVVIVHRRDATTRPAGSGGIRVTCAAADGGDVAADRDRLLVRATQLATGGTARVEIDGDTAVITVPGADLAAAGGLCASPSLALRPLVAATVVPTRQRAHRALTLPTTEAEYDALSPAQQVAVTDALRATTCPARRPVVDVDTTKPQIACATGDPQSTSGAALLGPALVTQVDVADAEAVAPSAGGAPSWSVAITLSPPAVQAVAGYTADHNAGGVAPSTDASGCGPQTVPCADYLGFVLDGTVVSLPLIVSPINSGVVQLARNDSEASARRLATQLAASLPVALRVSSVDPY